MNPLSSKKVLIVDDDPDILTVARYALKPLNHLEIKCVDSGVLCLEEAKSFKPDLILLDVMMPKMDGISTLKALKQIPETASIPVALFTAKVTRVEIKSYKDLGIVDVIIKPFDPSLFRMQILKLLEKR